jgi:heme/copper-type cytochrome/quinol oxidase subunit 2
MITSSAMVLWLCTIAALAVFSVMIYSIVSFSGPREAEPGARRSKVVEIFWALIPIAIVCFAALPAVQSITTPDQPVTILARSS